MRKVLLILLLLTFTTLSFANERPNYQFYINTGISKPASPKEFSEGWRSGANLGLGVSKTLTKNISIMGTACYNVFMFNSTGYERTLESTENIMSIDGKSNSVINLNANIKLSVPSEHQKNIIPYLLVRGGLFRYSKSDVTMAIFIDNPDITQIVNEDEIIKGGVENVLGTGFALGFDFIMDDVYLFAELGFDLGLTKKSKAVFFPIKFGVAIGR